MYTTNLTRPAYRHRWPMRLHCGNCDHEWQAYDEADSAVGAREWVDHNGDDASKCPECEEPWPDEVPDAGPDYDPRSRCD